MTAPADAPVPLPEPGEDFTWAPVTGFDGHLKKWAGNMQEDSLELTLSVSKAHKYEAMPMTDEPGIGLHFIVLRKVFDYEVPDGEG